MATYHVIPAAAGAADGSTKANGFTLDDYLAVAAVGDTMMLWGDGATHDRTAPANIPTGSRIVGQGGRPVVRATASMGADMLTDGGSGCSVIGVDFDLGDGDNGAVAFDASYGSIHDCRVYGGAGVARRALRAVWITKTGVFNVTTTSRELVYSLRGVEGVSIVGGGADRVAMHIGYDLNAANCVIVGCATTEGIELNGGMVSGCITAGGNRNNTYDAGIRNNGWGRNASISSCIDFTGPTRTKSYSLVDATGVPYVHCHNMHGDGTVYGDTLVPGFAITPMVDPFMDVMAGDLRLTGDVTPEQRAIVANAAARGLHYVTTDPLDDLLAPTLGTPTVSGGWQ